MSDMDMGQSPQEAPRGGATRRSFIKGVIAAGAVGAWAIMNGVVKVPTAIASKAPTSLCPATTFDGRIERGA